MTQPKFSSSDKYQRITERGLELKRRVLSHSVVNTTTGCIEWIKHRCQDGYGMMQFRKTGERRLHERAHRVAYMLWNGFVPDGMLVTHSCDNPSCVNPDHLRLGTRKTNMMEMATRQRQKQKAELSPEIKASIAAESGSINHIAAKYGISRTTAMKYRCR